jgi:glutamine synthetase adenylyltransferase
MLGYGFLADVQFTIEALLLRLGGPEPEVRTTSTLQAIELLAEGRLLDAKCGESTRAGPPHR